MYVPEPQKDGFSCNSVIAKLLHNHLHKQLGHVCIQMPSSRCIGIFLTCRAWDLGLLQEDAGKLQGLAAGEADGTSWMTLHVRKTASAFGIPSLQAALWMQMMGQKSLNFCHVCKQEKRSADTCIESSLCRGEIKRKKIWSSVYLCLYIFFYLLMFSLPIQCDGHVFQ